MEIVENVSIHCKIEIGLKVVFAIYQVQFWFVGTTCDMHACGSDGRIDSDPQAGRQGHTPISPEACTAARRKPSFA